MSSDNKLGLFSSIRYIVTGEIREEVKLLLQQNGAEGYSYFSDYLTHCIVGDNPCDMDISDAVDLYEIPAVTQEWVTYSHKCNKLLPTSAFKGGCSQLFTGVVATFSRLWQEDIKKLWAMLKYYGGTYNSVFMKTTTHLIVSEAEGWMYHHALKFPSKVHVVTPDWLVDSVRAGCLLDIDSYHPRLLLEKPALISESQQTNLIRPWEHDAESNSKVIPGSKPLEKGIEKSEELHKPKENNQEVTFSAFLDSRLSGLSNIENQALESSHAKLTFLSPKSYIDGINNQPMKMQESISPKTTKREVLNSVDENQVLIQKQQTYSQTISCDGILQPQVHSQEKFHILDGPQKKSVRQGEMSKRKSMIEAPQKKKLQSKGMMKRLSKSKAQPNTSLTCKVSQQHLLQQKALQRKLQEVQEKTLIQPQSFPKAKIHKEKVIIPKLPQRMLLQSRSQKEMFDIPKTHLEEQQTFLQTNTQPLGLLQTHTQIPELLQKSTQPLGLLQTSTQQLGLLQTDTQFIGLLQTNTQPLGFLRTNNQPLRFLQTNNQPLGLLQANTKPLGFLQSNNQPIGLLQTNTKPLGFLQSNNQPLGLLQTNTQPLGGLLQTNTKPLGFLQSNNQPLGLFQTNTQPLGGLLQTNTKPLGFLQSNNQPLGLLQTNTQPLGGLLQTNTKPLGFLQSNTQPLGGLLQTNTKPLGFLQSNTQPLGGLLQTNTKPLGFLQSNNQPLGLLQTNTQPLGGLLQTNTQPLVLLQSNDNQPLGFLQTNVQPLGLLQTDSQPQGFYQPRNSNPSTTSQVILVSGETQLNEILTQQPSKKCSERTPEKTLTSQQRMGRPHSCCKRAYPRLDVARSVHSSNATSTIQSGPQTSQSALNHREDRWNPLNLSQSSAGSPWQGWDNSQGSSCKGWDNSGGSPWKGWDSSDGSPWKGWDVFGGCWMGEEAETAFDHPEPHEQSQFTECTESVPPVKRRSLNQ